MKYSLTLLLTFFGVTTASLCAAPVETASAQPTPVIAAVPFQLSDVRLLDGPFKQAQELDRKVLLSIDPQRLLLMFRVTAGLSSDAKPLGGWEGPGCELRGHSLGHYLTACSLMVASTGDAELKKRCDTIVAELAKCQAAMVDQGYHAGYLSAFPESLFNRVDAQTPVWAPWYTMHKIMAGLLDAHVHTGNPQALEVLVKLADWVKYRVDHLTPEKMQASLNTEHGGMNEVLANLYGVTRNPEHLRLAEAFNHQAVFAPLLRGEDALDPLHGNTQIPKIIGAAREFELTGKGDYRQVAKFFWERVALHRSFALGGHGDREFFFPITDFAKHLSTETAETCNTYNMLKLTGHLFSWTPTAQLMDFYERGLYNQILGSQDPNTGMFTYLVGMKPGHFKTYSTLENSFWCCFGTGMENHARYGEEIYSHDAGSLSVNLFVASELSWSERGVTLRQITKFPEQATTQLLVHTRKTESFVLKIRQPGWCSAPISISVNGQSSPAKTDEQGYVSLSRSWTDGDLVEVSIPMGLRTEPLPGNPNIVAFFYGPVLLAGALGTDGLPEEGAYAFDQTKYVKWPATPVASLPVDATQVLSKLNAVPGQALTYKMDKSLSPSETTLIPFYKLHHQRYSVYWTLSGTK